MATGRDLYDACHDFAPEPWKTWAELTWQEQQAWEDLAVEQAARDEEE